MWGTRVPGYLSPALGLGVVLLIASLVGIHAWYSAVRWVRRRGYPDRQPDDRVRQWTRRANVAALAFAVIVLTRPMLYAGFWLSKPWMDRKAQAILAQPFSTPVHTGGGPRGLYLVGHCKRCPHGVKIVLRSPNSRVTYDQGAGFFFRIAPGECQRFNIGQPLGAGGTLSMSKLARASCPWCVYSHARGAASTSNRGAILF
jgi:hypothetical protein